jgi:hypothetical protein
MSPVHLPFCNSVDGRAIEAVGNDVKAQDIRPDFKLAAL